MKLSELAPDVIEDYVDKGLYTDQQVIDLYDELHEAKTGQLQIDLLARVVNRGDVKIMTVDELLFLLASAKEYDENFMADESRRFMQELHDTLGTGMTPKQFEVFMERVRGEGS